MGIEFREANHDQVSQPSIESTIPSIIASQVWDWQHPGPGGTQSWPGYGAKKSPVQDLIHLMHWLSQSNAHLCNVILHQRNIFCFFSDILVVWEWPPGGRTGAMLGLRWRDFLTRRWDESWSLFAWFYNLNNLHFFLSSASLDGFSVLFNYSALSLCGFFPLNPLFRCASIS